METNSTHNIRSSMKTYWQENSSAASIEEMMLDSEAESLSREELPEIMSYIPDFTNRRVIELGAGIGRFTTVFAESAYSVVAVDFTKAFIDKNRATNNHYGNVRCICADVTELDMKSKSADLVFSNWLLMYLDDGEVQRLLQKLLDWMDDDGFLFIRESCFHSSGNLHVSFNPTIYRTFQTYADFFTQASTKSSDGRRYGLKTLLSKPLDTYIKHKDNSHQGVWLLQKIVLED